MYLLLYFDFVVKMICNFLSVFFCVFFVIRLTKSIFSFELIKSIF